MKLNQDCGQPIIAIRNSDPLVVVDAGGKLFSNMGFLSLACKTKDSKYFIYHAVVGHAEGKISPVADIKENVFEDYEPALENFRFYISAIKRATVKNEVHFDVLLFDKDAVYTVNKIERTLASWIIPPKTI